MPKPNAAAELAQKLVEALRGQRDQGGNDYPPTVAQLRTLIDPQPLEAEFTRALARKPFAAQMIVAVKKDADSPIALAEDAERLAGSRRLLEYALNKLCTANAPLWPVSKVIGQVDRALRPAFEAALNRQIAGQTLPETAGSQMEKNRPNLYLKKFPPPEKPKSLAAQLSEKLVRVLESQRALGEGSYPLTLSRLHELTDPEVKAPLRKKALQEEPCRSQVVVALPDQKDSLVALAQDREVLASSPTLLESLLQAATSKREPLATLEQLKEMVGEPLRQPFEEAVRRGVANQSLPGPVGSECEDGEPRLFLKRLRPVKKPSLALAEKLLHELRAQRQQPNGAYPPTLSQLLRKVGSTAPPDLVPKALSEKIFKSSVVLALANNPETLLALAEDSDRLATSPRLLEIVLSAARSADTQAATVGDLKKKIAKGLQKPFEDTLGGQIERGSLPPGVGCLRIKKQSYLFLLKDIGAPLPPLAPGSSRPTDKAPAPLPRDFVPLFEHAFHKLDQQTGSHNHVSLVDLRPAVPVDRAAFDAGLHQLRHAGRYGLSAAEGRDGISHAERAAGIVEEGTLLLFVSRKTP